MALARPDLNSHRALALLLAAAAITALAVLSCGTDKRPAPTQPPDARPPAAVRDLIPARAESTSVYLLFTATGAHDTTGIASRYDLRYAAADTVPWERMTAVPSVPSPRRAGERETLAVMGLTPSTTYRFLLRVANDAPSWSGPSNAAIARTPGRARPPAGDAGWWDGFAPYPRGNGVAGVVRAMQVHDGFLYVAGDVTQAGGIVAAHVARWDGQRWASLGAGVNGTVNAMAEFRGDLIVAGQFTRAGGIDASGIARWDGASWHAVGSTGTFEGVNCLATFQDDLIASVQLRPDSLFSHQYLARWDGSAWTFDIPTPVDQIWALSGVEALLSVGGRAGIPYEISDVIASWDGTAWSTIFECPEPYPVICCPQLWGLASYGGELIGLGTGLECLPPAAGWGGAAWRDLGLPMTGYVDMEMPAAVCLAPWDGGLAVAGFFHVKTDMTGWNIALWKGGRWSTFGHGIDYEDNSVDAAGNGWAYALAVYDGSLYVGGNFRRAGRKPSRNIARWGLPP